MNTNTDYAALYCNDVSRDLDFFEKNAQDYPASSLARFILLYHLKKNNDPRFDEQAKQTGIYLHNPNWIAFQLSKLQSESANVLVVNPEENIESDNNGTNVKEEVQQEFAPIVVDHEEENDGDVKAKEELPLVGTEEIIENLPLETEAAETENVADDNDTAEKISDETSKELIDNVQNHEELPVAVNEENRENLNLESESPKTENATDANENAEKIPDGKQEDLIQLEQPQEELPVAVNEEINDNLNLENSSISIENEDVDSVENKHEEESIEVPVLTAHDQEVTQEDFDESESGLSQLENKDSITEENEGANFNKDESVFDVRIPDQTENRQVETIAESEETNEEDDDLALPFEPLHTVDYFASQGIKLTEEALNNDQLGRQVKSFTAWLKSMKKLHPGQLPEQNEVIEKLIQTSSEVSNQNANVLTEAMADVLVKQGKREKAIEMYQKLSLINPSKSAYFAAKIESLKII